MRKTRGLFLLPRDFKGNGVPCVFRAAAVAVRGVKLNNSAGIIRITDRDTIIERHEKSVGVSVKKEGYSQPYVMRACEKMKRRLPLQLPKYVSAAGDLYDID